MAEPPGPTRKPYFPTSQDIAGYSNNRQLTESYGGLVDPNQFEAFTLFPEGHSQSAIETPEFVWGDRTSRTTSQLPTSDCFSSPVYSHSPPNLSTFEEFNSRVPRQDLSPPVHCPPSPNYSASNGFSSHLPEEQNLAQQFGFGEASQQGYDLYTNALDNWNNFPTNFSSYSPFGSTEGLRYTTQSAEKDLDNKPSYSEVARSSRIKSGQSVRLEPSLEGEGRKSDFLSTKGHRVVRKGLAKASHHSKGNRPESVTPTLPVHPDSKYGLDQFEDPAISRKNSSCGSLPDDTSSVESLDHYSGPDNAATGLLASEETLYKPVFSKTQARYPTFCKDTNKSKGNKSGLSNSSSLNKANKMSNQSMAKEGNVETPKPFFDPKRIFQSKHYTSSPANKKSPSGHLADGDSLRNTTILNNGKISYSSKPTTTTAPKCSSDYINNDLRDTKKKSSNHGSSTKDKDCFQKNVQDASCSGKFFKKPDKSTSENIQQTGKLKSQVNHENGVPLTNSVDEGSGSLTRRSNIDQEMIDEWLSFFQEKASLVCRYTWSITVTLVLLLIALIVFVVSRLSFFIVKVSRKIWQLILSTVFRRGWEQTGGLKPGEARLKSGLDENITLPTTGDEAMQRLLACKGKDPYSILGLHFQATDDEVKKYYKRQAVLVHPDKNQQAGAEEAFKILGHAFELIGEPDKRRAYDTHLHEASETETAMQEFADLLTKLQEKIHEAANMMRCDNCGGKHRRIPVERPWYSARFCDRCNQFHSVKEGDVWAETTMLGFLWHYYACMEGKVFDITEWVACRRDFFKHMQANAHHVFYRIATEGNRNHQQGRSGENDLEDFINHLFHRAMSSEGSESSQWSGEKPAASSTPQSTWTGKESNLRRKKKKKKH